MEGSGSGSFEGIHGLGGTPDWLRQLIQDDADRLRRDRNRQGIVLREGFLHVPARRLEHVRRDPHYTDGFDRAVGEAERRARTVMGELQEQDHLTIRMGQRTPSPDLIAHERGNIADIYQLFQARHYRRGRRIEERYAERNRPQRLASFNRSRFPHRPPSPTMNDADVREPHYYYRAAVTPRSYNDVREAANRANRPRVIQYLGRREIRVTPTGTAQIMPDPIPSNQRTNLRGGIQRPRPAHRGPLLEGHPRVAQEMADFHVREGARANEARRGRNRRAGGSGRGRRR